MVNHALARPLVPVSVDVVALAAEASPRPMAVLSTEPPETAVIWCNDAFEKLFAPDPLAHSLAAYSLLGRPILELIRIREVEDSDLVADLLHRDGAAVQITYADGSHGTTWAQVAPIPGHNGQWLLSLAEDRDPGWTIKDLRASEERFRALAANAPVGVFFSEVGVRLGYVNDRFVELFGAPRPELLGTGWLAHLEGDHVTLALDALSAVLDGEERDFLLRVARPHGDTLLTRVRASPVTLRDNGAGFVGSIEDVTLQHRQQAELEHQANHDALTGLPNRAHLLRQLEAVCRAGRLPVGLIYADLDNFKIVNDTLGHAAGDALLQKVATLLSDTVRSDDIVARLGGDEFVVLCTRVRTAADLDALVERVNRLVQIPVDLGGREIKVTATMGTVFSDDPRDTPDSLLRAADHAMYVRKSRKPRVEGAGR